MGKSSLIIFFSLLSTNHIEAITVNKIHASVFFRQFSLLPIFAYLFNFISTQHFLNSISFGVVIACSPNCACDCWICCALLLLLLVACTLRKWHRWVWRLRTLCTVHVHSSRSSLSYTFGYAWICLRVIFLAAFDNWFWQPPGAKSL